MLGVAISTVAGRLMISLFCGVGWKTSPTASQISQRELELGAGEALRRILEHAISVPGSASASLLDQLGAAHGDVADAGCTSMLEHDAALQARGRVVEMDDRALGAAAGLEGALDQLGPALRQHLDGDVVAGSSSARCSSRTKSKSVCDADGKPTSISLKPMSTEQLEHARLAVVAHRLDQRLVAVAQVDRAPDRRLGDDLGRPLPVRRSGWA